jgi:hypothetical protein
MRRTLPIRSRQLAKDPVKAQASRRRHYYRGDKRLGTKRRRRFGLEALERREMLTGDLSGAEAALAATMANLAGQEQDAIETRDQAVADAQEDYADAYATAYGTFVSNENDAWDDYQDDIEAANGVYNGIENPAVSTYQGVLNTTDATYTTSITTADQNLSNATAQAEADFETDWQSAQNSYNADVATATGDYNDSVADATSTYNAALGAADLDFDNAAATAEDDYGDSVIAANAVFEASDASAAAFRDIVIAGLESTYASAVSGFAAVRDIVLALADSAYLSSMASAESVHQSDIADANADHAAAIASANTAQDAAVDAAQATYDAALAAALAVYQAGPQDAAATTLLDLANHPDYLAAIASAETSYNTTVTAEDVALAAAIALADADYAANMAAAQSAFEAALATAQTGLEISLQMADANYDAAVAAADATRQSAIDSAGATFEADYASAVQAEALAIAAADAVYQAAVLSAAQTLSAAIASADAVRTAAVDAAADTREDEEEAAATAFDNTQASLGATRDSDKEWADGLYDAAVASAQADYDSQMAAATTTRDNAIAAAAATYDAHLASATSTKNTAMQNAATQYDADFQQAQDDFESAKTGFRQTYDNTMQGAHNAFDATMNSANDTLWVAQQAYYASWTAIYAAQLVCMEGGGTCDYSADYQAAENTYNDARKQFAVTKVEAELQVVIAEKGAAVAYATSEGPAYVTMATAIATAANARRLAEAQANEAFTTSMAPKLADFHAAVADASAAWSITEATEQADLQKDIATAYKSWVTLVAMIEQVYAIDLADAGRIKALADASAEQDYKNAVAVADEARDAAVATAEETEKNAVASAHETKVSAMSAAETAGANAVASAQATHQIAVANAESAFVQAQSTAAGNWTTAASMAYATFTTNEAAARTLLVSLSTSAQASYVAEFSSAISAYSGNILAAWKTANDSVATTAASIVHAWALTEGTHWAAYMDTVAGAVEQYTTQFTTINVTHQTDLLQAELDHAQDTTAAEISLLNATAAAAEAWMTTIAPTWASFYASEGSVRATLSAGKAAAEVQYVTSVMGAFTTMVSSLANAAEDYGTALASANSTWVAAEATAATTYAGAVATANTAWADTEAQEAYGRDAAIADANVLRVTDIAVAERQSAVARATARKTWTHTVWPAWVTYSTAHHNAVADWMDTVWHDYADYTTDVAGAATQLVTDVAPAHLARAQAVSQAWATFNVTMAGIQGDRHIASATFSIASVNAQEAAAFSHIEPWTYLGLTINWFVGTASSVFTSIHDYMANLGESLYLTVDAFCTFDQEIADQRRRRERVMQGILDDDPSVHVDDYADTYHLGPKTELVIGTLARLNFEFYGVAAGLANAGTSLADDVAASAFEARQAMYTWERTLGPCFVAGTPVVMGEQAEVAVAGDSGYADQFIAIAIAGTALAVDFAARRRKKRRREEQADLVFAHWENKSEPSTARPLADQPFEPDLVLDNNVGMDHVCDRSALACLAALAGEDCEAPAVEAHGEPRSVQPARREARTRAATERRGRRSQATKPLNPGNWGSRLGLVLCLALAAFIGLRGIGGASRQPNAAAGTKLLQTKAIEQVRIFDRVLGTNPLPEDTQRGLAEPDADSWKVLRLTMVKANGKRLDVQLARPQAWIDGVGAVVGGTVQLNLAEMGAYGQADVLAIESCPPLSVGPGEVVTGTFAHEPDDNLLNIGVEGDPTPIGCTPNHLFWSVDRTAFIEAGELRTGERVETRALGEARIASIAPRPFEKLVYNLEVHGEHVYEVGALGTLVHNAYHHIATNKNTISEARGGPWTPKFKPLFDKAGVDMDSIDNIVDVPGHRGPHPEAYHDAILNSLLAATKNKTGQQWIDAFKARLALLKVQCATEGHKLNNMLTNPQY